MKHHSAQALAPGQVSRSRAANLLVASTRAAHLTALRQVLQVAGQTALRPERSRSAQVSSSRASLPLHRFANRSADRSADLPAGSQWLRLFAGAFAAQVGDNLTSSSRQRLPRMKLSDMPAGYAAEEWRLRVVFDRSAFFRRCRTCPRGFGAHLHNRKSFL